MPAPKPCQSLHQICNIPPAYLQALQHFPMPYVTPQQHHQRPFEAAWVPRHLHTGANVRRQFHTFGTIEIIVLQYQPPIGQHTLHCRRENQVPRLVNRKPLSFLRRRRLTSGSVHLSTWAPIRIHTLSFVILPQHTHTTKKSCDILREGDAILKELVQPCSVDGNPIDLHVFQSNQHGLDIRSLPEQHAKLLMREVPTRVHVVQVRHLRHNTFLYVIPIS